jgi:O-antigen ligase
MAKVGWIWELGAFVLLGSLAALAMNGSWGITGVGLLVLVPIAAVAFLVACKQGVRNALGILSSFSWWHVLWLLVFLSGLVFRVRDVREISEQPVDGWALFRIGLQLVTALVLAFRLVYRKPSWMKFMAHGLVGAMATYGLVCTVSTVWSVFPAWTIYKSLEFLVDLALLAAILATVRSLNGLKDLFNWTWALYGLLLLSTCVGAVLWPEEALEATRGKIGLLGFQLAGVMPVVPANTVGDCSAIIGIVALSRLLNRGIAASDRAWYSLLLAGTLVTQVLSQTRSALAGFLLAVVLVLYYSKRLAKGAILSLFVIPLLAVPSIGALVWAFLQRGQSEQQLTSLSSRMDWWAVAWGRFLEQPLTGLGAYAAGRFAVLAKLGATKTSTMHSDYLEIIVGTGVWGLIPVLVAVVGAWWVLHRTLRHYTMGSLHHQLALEALGVLGVLTVRSVFMSILTWHPPLHFLAVLGLAELLRRQKKNDATPVRSPALERGVQPT